MERIEGAVEQLYHVEWRHGSGYQGTTEPLNRADADAKALAVLRAGGTSIVLRAAGVNGQRTVWHYATPDLTEATAQGLRDALPGAAPENIEQLVRRARELGEKMRLEADGRVISEHEVNAVGE